MPSSQNPEETITIRTWLYPSFYPRFRCLADQCRDDCCQNWKIAFNKKDYLTIKQAKKSPQLEELTRQAVHRLRKGSAIPEQDNTYAEFRAQGQHCPFFSDKGLCSLQLECGEQTLPLVCRIFPRKKRYTYVDQISALSPACEGALRLLWDMPDGIDFVMDELPQHDWCFVPPRSQYWLYPLLRERCIDILQARQFSLERRLLMLGLALEQVCREGWDLDGKAWSHRVDLLLSDPTLSQPLDCLPANRGAFLADRLRLVWKLSDANPFFRQAFDFVKGVCSLEKTVNFTFSQEAYDRAQTDMDGALGERLEIFFENLMVNIFCFLGYPRMEDPEDVWRSFVNLCSLWAFLRFSAVVGYGLNPSLEGMFHGVVMASRTSLHNSARMDALQEELFSNDSADLAHLSVLIRG